MQINPDSDLQGVTVSHLSISLRGRSTTYAVARDLSFTIPHGRSLGVVGESGAGKSVTAMALMGLLPSSFQVDGSINLAGRELNALSDKSMAALRGRNLFMILQDASVSLNPSLKIMRQLSEVPRMRRMPGASARWEAAVQVLREVEFADPARVLELYPHELSGGMRQRVVIAMGLLAQPQLLIADEPTSALDVLTQRSVLSVLRDSQLRHQLTMLFVSHDLRAIARVCDDVLVMYAGRIVEKGPVQDIISSPRHPYTVGLLESIPPLTERRSSVHTIKGDPPAITATSRGCPFVARCERALDRCHVDFPPQSRLGTSALHCWNPSPVVDADE